MRKVHILSGSPSRHTGDGRPVWTVPLADLTAQVRPAYGGQTWAEAVALLMGDPVEAETVTTLTRYAHGGFARPVVIDAEEQQIANGMHRVAAAVVTGASHVDVTDRFPAEGTDDVDVLDVQFALTRAGAPLSGEEQLTAAEAIRSFPIGEDWTESDVFAWQADRVSGCWYWPLARAGELTAALHDRMSARGFTLHLHSVELLALEDDDAPMGGP